MTTRRKRSPLPWACYLFGLSGYLLAPLLGCKAPRAAPAATEEPNAEQTETTESVFYCKETTTPLGADNLAPSSWQRTEAPSLQARAYSTGLVWQLSEKGHSYLAETEPVQLTLTISSTSDIEVVTRNAANRDPTGNIPLDVTNESLGCVDTLRTTATGVISTDGGSLNEPLTLVFEAQPSGVWLTQADLDLSSLAGSFSAQLLLPSGYEQSVPPVLRIALGLSATTMVGDLELLSGELQDASSMTRQDGVRERIAHFPVGNFCGPEVQEVSHRQLERRTAMSAALAILNEAQPVMMVRDEEGSPEGSLQLEFRAADDRICSTTENSVQSVLLTRAEVSMLSADGRVEGTIATDIVVLPEPFRIEASAQLASQDSEFNASLPGRFGITDPVALENYDSASVQLVVGVSDTDAWGSLQVLGRSTQACGGAEASDNSTLFADAGVATSPVCGEQRLWGVHWGQVPGE